MATAKGTATIDFTSTPSDEASVTVTGQTSIAVGDHVEAFFMRDSTAGNGVDEHEEAAAMCRLVCGSIVAGTSFVITAMAIHALAVGTFSVRWVRSDPV